MASMSALVGADSNRIMTFSHPLIRVRRNPIPPPRVCPNPNILIRANKHIIGWRMANREAEMERQLKVLANRRRLAILSLLRKKKEASVGEIAESIRLSFTSTSKHLTMLERAGFLEKEQ